MRADNDFGAFFREIRQGLGLSLREFCRQTGFDQANISRLERGLLSPPKSKKVLTTYAKALRLKEDTAEWERFMTLAKPPAKSRRGQSHKNWVTARSLEEWAKSLNARSVLPQLVRRLIRAGAQGLVRLEAPAGEQIQRPGWDGFAVASDLSEFVPQGNSAWEMGVDKDPKAKANTDFAKRLKNTPANVREITTFIFVTPRTWQKKAEWVEEKTNLKQWKAVKAYDSAALEECLENAPAVDIWLARQLGLCPPGIIDVDEHWENLQALTDPSFEPQVHLASRDKEFEQLKTWLKGPPDTLVIESRSPAEAVDFVVAASRTPEFGEAFAARALIVETRDAWRTLSGGDAKLVLMVHPELAIEAELTAEAVRKGHHVIVCATGPCPSPCSRIDLPRVSRLGLLKALEAQGVDHDKAAQLATSAGGSIAVLKRCTARHPGTVHPDWSRPQNARAVLPLLLAGRWSDSSAGDRLAIEKLADAPYRDILAHAERWAGPPEPLLRRLPAGWELISREDAWTLLSHAVSDEDLRRFETVSLEVFSELDPACELSSDERWQAQILGKIRSHSSALRTGLAESLALLSARPLERKGGVLDPKNLVAHVVRTTLAGKDWRTWNSLSSVLPLLAEASPDAFLTALENDLAQPVPAVLKLFEPDSSPLFGSSLHTKLLFALECLAWDRSSLPRVSQLLARLHEDAPPVNTGNSPLRTLTQVFMPWYPQTTAPVQERVKILQALAKKYPQAGWRLLLELLPTSHSVVSNNCRPAFRNWTLEWSKGPHRADYAFQVDACADLIVDTAANDTSRLKDAVEGFENLPPQAKTKLLELMANISPSTLNVDQRRALTEVIREKVHKHRQFASSDWALKGELIEQLDRARQHFEPSDVVARNAWLFADYWTVHWQLERPDEDDEEATKVVEQLRTKAMDEVRSEQGWDGVLALSAAATSPDQVGWVLGARRVEGDQSRVLPQLLTDERKAITELAKGYVRQNQKLKGWDWIDALPLDRWLNGQVVEFALALPSEPNAWDLVAKRGAEAEEQFWKNVAQFNYSRDAAQVHRASSMFMKVGRAFAAVRQLAIALHRKVQLNPVAIIEVLQGYSNALNADAAQVPTGQVANDLKALIQKLQCLLESNCTGVDANTVARLEWMYLTLLDGHPTNPKILHKCLAEDPNFLMQLLTFLFPGNDEKDKAAETSESDQARAVQAYRLLNSWTTVPGSKPDGSIDEEVLRRWIETVQSLADKEARREAADFRIGSVLAYASDEPDGSWPRIPVRDAIEEFGTQDLLDGFELAIMNKRGAYTKALEEGGVQEREIAKQYFAWAESSQVEWKKTAASLRRVGERYEADARREDARAQSF